MEKLPKCQRCGYEYIYEDGDLYVCPECGHEWPKNSDSQGSEVKPLVCDAHGNLLQDGDSVVVIKDLKVKGASSSLKAGVKIKNIHLVEEVDGHNVQVKVKGFGSLILKSEFLKKAN